MKNEQNKNENKKKIFFDGLLVGKKWNLEIIRLLQSI